VWVSRSSTGRSKDNVLGNTVSANMVKPGAVVIDVGVNRVEDKTKASGFRLVGDVDFEGCRQKASLITPVPGAVPIVSLCAPVII
jgi:methylenetetrahydrofolate dehydrogenase (NADP+)/methenyltetrahydrofolate cyclohydrolase